MTGPRASGPGEPLRRSAVAGVGWVTLQQFGSRLIGGIGFVLLARLLAPQDFGLLAQASIVTGVLTAMLEHSVTTYLVQHRDARAGTTEVVLLLAVVTSGATAVGLALVADPLAAAIGADGGGDVLALLGLAIPLSVTTAVPWALLTRELAFRTLAVRGLLATALGLLVAVPLAAAGLGVYALVAQYLAQVTFSAVWTWRAAGWRPRHRPAYSAVPHVLAFSRHVVGIQAVTYVNRRSDDLIIGYVLGPRALGYYVVAYRLLTLVLDASTGTVNAVATPVLARLRDDVPRMLRAFHRAVALSAAAAFPVFTLLIVGAPLVVPGLFGAQWTPAVLPSQVLAAAGFVICVGSLDRGLLVARGAIGKELRYETTAAVVGVTAFVVAAPHGIEWVALAAAARTYLTWPLKARFLVQVGVRLGEYWSALRPYVGATLAVLAVAGGLALSPAPAWAAALLPALLQGGLSAATAPRLLRELKGLRAP